MGVKGLATFIKENRQSLCRSVHLTAGQAEGQERIPVVVDSWGVIYTLWLACLPWQSGGEYLRFYRLTCRLVEAWREVGLEPTFVFDGSAPNEKLDTQLRRLDDTLRTAQLFYTTSPASRSGPSFSRDQVILPPFASHTFVHALADLDVATHFVPLGEADGECVTLAEQLGGYIFGQDSDYPILVSAPGLRRVRGYCPLEMMMWIEDDPGVRRKEALQEGTGWTSVAPVRKEYAGRSSPLLPPSGMRRPKLVMTAISPGALRTRLRLPAAMMPLFASLVGNDYTPPAAPDHFFQPGSTHIAKIEKVARTIREVVFATQQQPSVSGSNAGDNAVELVRTIISKLAWKPFVSDGVMFALVEAIIKATFQYILPVGGVCCGVYPFCGELDKGCETRPPSRAMTPMSADRTPEKADTDYVQQARKMYAMGQRKGIMQSMTHAWLYPDRVVLWSVLEDPSGPSLKATVGMRGMRERAYLIAEEGLGGLRWPEDTEEEEAGVMKMEELKVDEKPHSVMDGEGGVTEMMGSLECSATEKSDESSSPGTTVVEEPTKKAASERRITEYVRHTNRYASFLLDLPPLLSQPVPTCLLPLPERLKAYLEPLLSAHPSMLTLPPQIQPLAAITRFSALEASKSRTDDKWKRSDVEAVLKSFIWTLSTWTWEKRSRVLSRPDPELTYPVLTNRHSQIVAQLGVVMIDSIMLAQSLLLAPYTATEPPSTDAAAKPPVVGRRMPTLTHLTPWMFFSGVSLHTLLSGSSPPGWEWSEKDEATYKTCLEAVMDGLDGDVVKGWPGGTGSGGTGNLLVSPSNSPGRGEEEAPRSKAGGKRGKQKKLTYDEARAGQAQAGMGRFGVLGASQA